MPPLPDDPFELRGERPIERRPDLRRPAGERAAPEAGSLLPRLIDLVTARAGEVARAGAADPDPMERLREAVEALGHVLDALRLVAGTAGGHPEATASSGPPAVRSAPVRPPAGWDEPARPVALPADPAPPEFAPYRDPLTGLHSRAGFDAIVGGELGRCRRHARELSIGRLRLAGADDAGLRDAARRFRQGLRASDLLGRDGEGGFVLGFPETGPEDSMGILRRIVDELRPDGGRGPGAWIGVAGFPEDGDSLDTLLEAARARMADGSAPSAPYASDPH